MSRWQSACRAGAALLVCCALALPARAQTEWWESLQSFGSPDYNRRPSSDRPARVPDNIDDLRPDATPWRSDATIEATARAIDRYQQIVANGGWPQVPAGKMMREGDDDNRVPLLRRRLVMSGDLQQGRSTGNFFSSSYFDSDLEAAVRRFQRHNGLRPTGRIEQSNYAVLNISAQERLAQLKLNIARLRELLQANPEDRYVLVNVPAFQLEAVERYEVQQRHRVIVGRTERQTPSVKASIRALNFFPYWHVPDSVARLDIVPRMQKEPDYISKEKIRALTAYGGPEVDDRGVDWFSPAAQQLKFRQDPGPQNALGLVRIDMPNEHTVYMHDTPLKNLFDQRSRAFSAGCVRVQGVFKLAEWIAKYEQGWDKAGQVDAVLASGQALDLTLTRPIPVYFTYVTAWAEQNGDVEFRPDIYGRDGTVDYANARDPDEPAPPPTLAP